MRCQNCGADMPVIERCTYCGSTSNRPTPAKKVPAKRAHGRRAGLIATYVNGCRCDACKKAARATAL